MRVLSVTVSQNLGFQAAACVSVSVVPVSPSFKHLFQYHQEYVRGGGRGMVFPLPLLEDEKLLEGMGPGSRLALGRWHLAEAGLPPLSFCDSTSQLLGFKA